MYLNDNNIISLAEIEGLTNLRNIYILNNLLEENLDLSNLLYLNGINIEIAKGIKLILPDENSINLPDYIEVEETLIETLELDYTNIIEDIQDLDIVPENYNFTVYETYTGIGEDEGKVANNKCLVTITTNDNRSYDISIPVKYLNSNEYNENDANYVDDIVKNHMDNHIYNYGEWKDFKYEESTINYYEEIENKFDVDIVLMEPGGFGGGGLYILGGHAKNVKIFKNGVLYYDETVGITFVNVLNIPSNYTEEDILNTVIELEKLYYYGNVTIKEGAYRVRYENGDYVEYHLEHIENAYTLYVDNYPEGKNIGYVCVKYEPETENIDLEAKEMVLIDLDTWIKDYTDIWEVVKLELEKYYKNQLGDEYTCNITFDSTGGSYFYFGFEYTIEIFKDGEIVDTKMFLTQVRLELDINVESDLTVEEISQLVKEEITNARTEIYDIVVQHDYDNVYNIYQVDDEQLYLDAEVYVNIVKKDVIINDKMIEGLTDKTNTVIELLDNFNWDENKVIVKDINGKTLEGDSKIGTGSTVELLNDVNEVINTYTTVVKGDLDGDGQVKSFDAYVILTNVAGSNNLTEAQILAGCLTDTTEVTSFDAYKVLLYVSNKTNEL